MIGAFKLNSIGKFTVTAVAEVIRSKKGITAVGNAQISTAQSQFGGASALFDGSGDYLIANSIDLSSYATSDWTVEGWIRINSLGATQNIWSVGYATNSFALCRLLVADDGDLNILCSNASASLQLVSLETTNQPITTNTWYHVAAVRNGSNFNLYLNGTSVASATNSGSVYTGSNLTSLGARLSSGSFGLFQNGWTDEFRISNTARYTSNFTAPTQPFVNDFNTLLLIHCDGTNASTFFEDDNGVRSSKGISAVGNAQISTAQSRFGGSSALFDGSGDNLQLSNSSDYNFGSNNFTVECWVRATNFTGFPSIMGMATIGTYGGWTIQFNTSGVPFFQCSTNNSSINITPGGPALSTGTWSHLAVVRNGNSIRVYKDGVGGTAVTITGSIITSSANLIIGDGYGVSQSFVAATDFNGHIDEVRISNTARYTANFTAPTQAFTNDDNTLLLIHADGTNASTVFRDDNGVRSPKGIQAIGNAQIDTAQSKFGGASALFDGSGDYLIIDKSVGDFGSSSFTVEAWVQVPSSDNAFENIAGIWHGTTAGNRSWIFAVDDTTSGVVFYWYDTSNNIDTSMETTTVLVANVWSHVAITSDGTTFRLFINGVLEDSAPAETIRTPVAGSSLTIGANYDGSLPLNGHIDEVRISNTARYTANFTPSTTPFQNDDNTVLLLHMDGTDASTVFFDDNGRTTTP